MVDFYYRVSPPIAEFIAEHSDLKPIVRAALVFNTAPAEKATILSLFVLLSVAVAVWVTKRRRRGPEHVRRRDCTST